MSDIKTDKRRKKSADPSKEYIDYICKLYGDKYDDRIEDSRPQGLDWRPGGQQANHLSLERFRKLLLNSYEINLSTAKIRKILITGGCWTTTQSRRIQKAYDELSSVQLVADKLGISPEFVTMNLPYEKVVYDLINKSGNAKRVERWRNRKMDRKVFEKI